MPHSDGTLHHVDSTMVYPKASFMRLFSHLFTNFNQVLLNKRIRFIFNQCLSGKAQNVKLRPKKVNYMFLRHHPCHLQPPRIKNFIVFPVFTLKNHLYITHFQFRLAVICFHFVCSLVGVHTKIFQETSWTHRFIAVNSKKCIRIT